MTTIKGCNMSELAIGDVVIPTRARQEKRKVLHCGSGIYTHAIVGSVDPFVLVSDSGDMVWRVTWEPHEVVVLCQAHESITQRVRARLAADAESNPRFRAIMELNKQVADAIHGEELAALRRRVAELEQLIKTGT